MNGVLKIWKCSLHVDNEVTEKHKRGREVLENEIVPRENCDTVAPVVHAHGKKNYK